jgi:hypothetical protein
MCMWCSGIWYLVWLKFDTCGIRHPALASETFRRARGHVIAGAARGHVIAGAARGHVIAGASASFSRGDIYK